MADELRQEITFGTGNVDEASKKLDGLSQKAEQTKQSVMDSVRQTGREMDAMLQKTREFTGGKAFTATAMTPEQAGNVAPYINNMRTLMQSTRQELLGRIGKLQEGGAPPEQIEKLRDVYSGLVLESGKLESKWHDVNRGLDPDRIDKWTKGMEKGFEGITKGTTGFIGAVGTGAIGITNILDGLKRGNIAEVAGGIGNLAWASGGMGGMAGGLGKFLMSGPGLAAMGAAIPAALLGIGTADIMGNWKASAQNQFQIMRSENLMGALGPTRPLGEQWATRMGVQYGMQPGEVAGTLSTFMMAGGQAGQARGITEQSLRKQFEYGTDAKVFAKAIGDMERWVPKGDFSNTISQGFIDAQRYGVRGLAASGELFQAQNQIAQTLSRTGGYFSAGTGEAARRIGVQMMQYGFAGEPGAQIAGQMAQALPGMMMDPLKAAQAYNVLGLSPMQLLRPGMPGRGGMTAPEQMMSRFQSPEFRAMVGGQMGAGLWAMGMGLNPELVMRMAGGEKVSAKEMKDMMTPEDMKQTKAIENLLTENRNVVNLLVTADKHQGDIVSSVKKIEEYTHQMAGGFTGKIGALLTGGPEGEKIRKAEEQRIAEGKPEKFKTMEAIGGAEKWLVNHIHIHLNGKEIQSFIQKAAAQTGEILFGQ